ncbi:MAG TPA: peptide ABC transporter substrate-binding protein [Candidatus Acidoferrales bacterium]|nr:peptide ABC transporter substrate-binding protein [Candidatus Acidoferrales bacterium]
MLMRLRALAAVAALAVTISACTKVGTENTTGGGRHPWTIPGVLRIGYPDEPDSLNPLFGHTAATDEADALIFAPFFRYDQRGEFFPELATKVPSYANGGISADGKTITLHMRRGVVWADGAPLTMRDLRFTWRAVMNPRNNVITQAGWDDIVSMTLPNPYTAVIHLARPNADVLGIFADGGAGFPPLPEHLLGKLADLNHADFNAHPLSSGPWILQRWNHGSSLEFAPNPRYWRGPPKLEHISWRVIPDNDTQLAQLETHEIDVYPTVSEDHLARVSALPGIAVARRLIANWRHLGINCSRPALSDARVRQAIAQAVDWDTINRTTYHGIDVRAVSDIMPTSWAAPTIPQWRYDPQAAKRLLTAAGFLPGADGIRARGDLALRITLSGGTNRPANLRAEVQIQQALRAVGIDVQIKNYPVSLLFAQDGPLYGGRYDLEWSTDTNGPDPDNQALWSGDFVPPHGANTSFYNDPLITRVSAQALRTYDRAERKRLYQIEETRIHQLALAVFFYWEVGTNAYNSDLKNYKPAQYITDNWNSWEWEI